MGINISNPPVCGRGTYITLSNATDKVIDEDGATTIAPQSGRVENYEDDITSEFWGINEAEGDVLFGENGSRMYMSFADPGDGSTWPGWGGIGVGSGGAGGGISVLKLALSLVSYK